ncbi:MAG: LptF/LptG family permease [Fusobacteriaceae bacterium]
MKKIDIHISKNFIRYCSLSFMAFLNIFILSQIFRVIKYVSNGDMTPIESFYYLMTLIPRTAVDVAPLSILLGGLISMNSMASNLEIISLKTSGISFKRMVVFPMIISFIVSLGIFYISDRVVPKAYEQSRILRGSDSKDATLPETKDDAFLRGENNLVYFIQKIDRIKNTGEKIQLIHLNSEFNAVERILVADSGKFDPDKKMWQFKDVHISSKTESQYFEEYSSEIYDEEPKSFITLGKDPRVLTNRELRKEMINLTNIGGDRRSFVQELAKRYSFPFASFVIAFIGLSLGSSYVRGGSGLSIMVAVIFGYGYYLVQGVFEAFGKNGMINPFLGNWIPNLIFLALGIYFMNKAEY